MSSACPVLYCFGVGRCFSISGGMLTVPGGFSFAGENRGVFGARGGSKASGNGAQDSLCSSSTGFDCKLPNCADISQNFVRTQA